MERKGGHNRDDEGQWRRRRQQTYEDDPQIESSRDAGRRPRHRPGRERESPRERGASRERFTRDSTYENEIEHHRYASDQPAGSIAPYSYHDEDRTPTDVSYQDYIHSHRQFEEVDDGVEHSRRRTPSPDAHPAYDRFSLTGSRDLHLHNSDRPAGRDPSPEDVDGLAPLRDRHDLHRSDRFNGPPSAERQQQPLGQRRPRIGNVYSPSHQRSLGRSQTEPLQQMMDSPPRSPSQRQPRRKPALPRCDSSSIETVMDNLTMRESSPLSSFVARSQRRRRDGAGNYLQPPVSWDDVHQSWIGERDRRDESVADQLSHIDSQTSPSGSPLSRGRTADRSEPSPASSFTSAPTARSVASDSSQQSLATIRGRSRSRTPDSEQTPRRAAAITRRGGQRRRPSRESDRSEAGSDRATRRTSSRNSENSRRSTRSETPSTSYRSQRAPQEDRSRRRDRSSRRDRSERRRDDEYYR